MPPSNGHRVGDGSVAASASHPTGGVHEEVAQPTTEDHAQPDEPRMQPTAASCAEAQSTPSAPVPAAPVAATAPTEDANGHSTRHAAGPVAADDAGRSPRAVHTLPVALNGAAQSDPAPQSPQHGASLPAPSPARSPAASGTRTASLSGPHSPAVAAAVGVITGEMLARPL
jgi:hypothetical protein